MNPSRRTFLADLGQEALDFLIPTAHAATTGQHTLVCVFLRGAMDALNSVVPYGEASYYDKRPSLAIKTPGKDTSSAIDLDGFFGFNPSLAALKPAYDAGDLAIVHACGAPFTSRSHFEAQREMEFGFKGRNGKADGWLGRHLALVPRPELDDLPFRSIAIGRALPGVLRGAPSASALSNVNGFDLTPNSNTDFSGLLQTLYAGSGGRLGLQAADTFKALQAMDYFAPGLYTAENGISYPKTGFGRSLLQVAQYIKSGMGTEVFCLDLGDWDHHENLNKRLSGRLKELAEGLSAFYTDMGERMQNTTVLVMSEFGRRVTENASGGVDHGRGSCMFVLGKHINGGRVYADWPGLTDQALNQGDLEITTDYRVVLGELLSRRMANTALDRVFPDFVADRELGLFP